MSNLICYVQNISEYDCKTLDVLRRFLRMTSRHQYVFSSNLSYIHRIYIQNVRWVPRKNFNIFNCQGHIRICKICLCMCQYLMFLEDLMMLSMTVQIFQSFISQNQPKWFIIKNVNSVIFNQKVKMKHGRCHWKNI